MPSSPATIAQIIQSSTSQTADLTEWQNSSGVTVASVTASGVFVGNGSGLTNITATIAPGNTNYIQNTNTLQSGATFYVSSGTVAGSLTVRDTNVSDTYSLRVGSSASVYHLVVSTGGNVGIGTATPGQSLDVNGSIQTNTGLIYSGGSSTGMTFTNGQAVAQGFQFVVPTVASQGILVTGLGDAYARRYGTAVNPLGISGTFNPASGASPFYALNVAPTINQTGTASGSYTGIRVNVTEMAAPGTANRLMDLQANSVSKMVVHSNGNVGIVSMAPSTKLHLSSGVVTIDGTGAGLAINGGQLGSTINQILATAERRSRSIGAKGNTQHVILNAATVTLSFSNGLSGRKYTLVLKQDATGGRAVTWPSGAGGARFSGVSRRP